MSDDDENPYRSPENLAPVENVESRHNLGGRAIRIVLAGPFGFVFFFSFIALKCFARLVFDLSFDSLVSCFTEAMSDFFNGGLFCAVWFLAAAIHDNVPKRRIGFANALGFLAIALFVSLVFSSCVVSLLDYPITYFSNSGGDIANRMTLGLLTTYFLVFLAIRLRESHSSV